MSRPNTSTKGKLLNDIHAVIERSGLSDGGCVSFHHHLRNGDGVMNLILTALGEAGLKGLHLEATSLFPVHAPLVALVEKGVIASIATSYMSGPLAHAISRGALKTPVRLRTHGGRARALDSGEQRIDVAFVAASAADCRGNLSARTGRAPFGVLGYPMADVGAAQHVVAVTDTIVPFPACPIDLSQDRVDMVLQVDRIGDPAGIGSGATRPAMDPQSVAIAGQAADVIAASGQLIPGFSFQTGAGGISIATAQAVGQAMTTHGVQGSFACGGISGFHVKMLEAGLFRSLMDVQCFDLEAVASRSRNSAHQSMSASAYAGPHVGGAVVDELSAVVLGAAQVDTDFNVNVTTRSDGLIIGGSGGHADAAQGAALTVVTTRLTAAGFAKVVPKVTTLTTPGSCVDVVVTEAGIAVNPANAALQDRLGAGGLPVVSIQDLAAKAAVQASQTTPPRASGRVVAQSEHREGYVLDEIRMIE